MPLVSRMVSGELRWWQWGPRSSPSFLVQASLEWVLFRWIPNCVVFFCAIPISILDIPIVNSIFLKQVICHRSNLDIISLYLQISHSAWKFLFANNLYNTTTSAGSNISPFFRQLVSTLVWFWLPLYPFCHGTLSRCSRTAQVFFFTSMYLLVCRTKLFLNFFQSNFFSPTSMFENSKLLLMEWKAVCFGLFPTEIEVKQIRSQNITMFFSEVLQC